MKLTVQLFKKFKQVENIWGKCLIHGTKHHNNNKLQSLERSILVEKLIWYKEVYGDKFNLIVWTQFGWSRD